MINKEIKTLVSEALTQQGCEDGIEQLKGSKDIHDLIDCFLDRIDFCLANNFPSIEFLSRYKKELEQRGVFINSDVKLRNQNQLVFLGGSSPTLLYDEFSVSRVYVKHDSRVKIRAVGNSFVMVDALDNSEVIVEKSGNAKVVVNLYSEAICSGYAKIIHKYRETYEL